MEGEVYINLTEDKKLTISEMRKMIEDDPTVDLKEKIKGGKLQVQWPHTKPPPTGEVRAKLIHQRMHQKQTNQYSLMDSRPSQLKDLSGIFTLIITIPCVAYSLSMILQWFGFSQATAQISSIIGGLISFFVELALIIISSWKAEKMQNFRKRPNDAHLHKD